LHGRGEDGPEDADRRAEPKIGAVEQGEIAVELHAAAADFDVIGPQFAQFGCKGFFEAAGTGCEKLQGDHQAPG
jgi:hypothetical protein